MIVLTVLYTINTRVIDTKGTISTGTPPRPGPRRRFGLSVGTRVWAGAHAGRASGRPAAAAAPSRVCRETWSAAGPTSPWPETVRRAGEAIPSEAAFSFCSQRRLPWRSSVLVQPDVLLKQELLRLEKLVVLPRGLNVEVRRRLTFVEGAAL
jgi:hypothetical protein